MGAAFPRWLLCVAALLLALPSGWSLGVFAAYLMAGPEFGQLPMVTVPFGLLAGLVFAAAPLFTLEKRLAVMAGACALFFAWGALSA